MFSKNASAATDGHRASSQDWKHDPQKGERFNSDIAILSSHFCLSFLLDVQIFLTYFMSQRIKNFMFCQLLWLQSSINSGGDKKSENP